MTIFNEIDGKRVSHMAETDYTDASDGEFGGSGRLSRIGDRSGHEFLAGRKAGVARISWRVESCECLILRFVEVPPNERLHIGRTIHAGQAGIKDELGYPR